MKTFLGSFFLLLAFTLNTFATVAFSPDGQTLASTKDGSIILWDVATEKERTKFGVSVYPRIMAFSPDGQTLTTVGWGSGGVGQIILWDVATGKQKATLELHNSLKYTPIALSSDGKTLVGTTKADESEHIILWDVATGKQKVTLGAHNSLKSVALSPDGQTLASVDMEAGIILWDIATGKEKATLGGTLVRYVSYGEAIAFSPDSRTFASSAYGSTILWDVATGTKIATLGLYSDRYANIAFSPDGQTLAGVSERIILWDVATGKEKATLGGTSDAREVYKILFSPDGQMLAAVGRGTTLWDVATRTKIATHQSISRLLFSPDSQALAGIKPVGINRQPPVILWKLPATQVRITPFPVESPSIGAQLTINVTIRAGQNVGGYQVSVDFDETALRYVESNNGNYLPPGAFAVPPSIWEGRVALAATALGGTTANGDGTLVTLTFEVLDIKESRLILSTVILTDSTGEPLPHLAFNGRVTDPQIGPEDVNSDGVVNILDLVKVASRFNQGWDIEKEDINGDGIVNIIDLVKVAGAIGGGAAGPSQHPQTLAMFTPADVQNWLSQAQQLNLTDTTSQRGILFLEDLLAALTPKETVLLPNYPNPFNPETWIPYQLSKPADVTLTIYAVDGTVVRTLALGHQPIGTYQGKSRAAYWDGRNALGETVASGLYFYTLTAGDFTATRKMLIRK